MAAMSVARKSHLDSLAISVLLACCMLWGFQQVLVKATIAEVAPVFQAALRFVLATAALWLWCGWRRIPLWAHDGTLWAGLLAGLLFAAEFVCIYLGLQLTTASRLTVFLYSSPLWLAVLLPQFVATERLRRLQWVGLACAFVGVLLALGDGFHNGRGGLLGDALGLLAGLLWALTTVTLRTTSIGRAAPEKQLFYQISVCALAFPLLSLALGETWNWQLSPFAIGSILVQALVGAFASYLAWVWLLVRYPATKLSVFVFLTPVFAILFGALWLKEPITLGLMGAMALVGAGIVLVNVRRDG